MTELRRVKGIGPKKFEAIRPFVNPIGPREDRRPVVAKEGERAAAAR